MITALNELDTNNYGFIENDLGQHDTSIHRQEFIDRKLESEPMNPIY